jgi:rfaE bifunctional protein kinase chain/domain
MRKLTFEDVKKENAFILQNLGRLEGRKILVVGDVGLDEYVMGGVRRISPEAPVPVLEVEKEEYRVGLAANVAQNVSSLGGKVVMLGVVGEDPTAQHLARLMRENGVSEPRLVADKDRPTTRKMRMMSGQHHIVRVDYEHRKFLPPAVENQVFATFMEVLPSVDGVILQDYGKGVLSEGLCQQLIGAAAQAGKPVAVDPHRTTPVRYYHGADLIKPNREEAFILSGLNLDDLRERADSIIEVAEAIRKQTNCKALAITSGSQGVYLFGDLAQKESAVQVPTSPRQVFDVTGAGDTFIAALTLAWWSGFSLVQAACVANSASGVVVGKIGSVPCSRPELVEALKA